MSSPWGGIIILLTRATPLIWSGPGREGDRWCAGEDARTLCPLRLSTPSALIDASYIVYRRCRTLGLEKECIQLSHDGSQIEGILVWVESIDCEPPPF